MLEAPLAGWLLCLEPEEVCRAGNRGSVRAAGIGHISIKATEQRGGLELHFWIVPSQDRVGAVQLNIQ